MNNNRNSGMMNILNQSNSNQLSEPIKIMNNKNHMISPITLLDKDKLNKDPNIIVITADDPNFVFDEYIFFKYENITLRMEKNHTVFINKNTKEIIILNNKNELVSQVQQQNTLSQDNINVVQQNQPVDNPQISPRDMDYLLLLNFEDRNEYFYVTGRQSAVDTILYYIDIIDTEYSAIMGENMIFKDCVNIITFLKSCIRNNSRPNVRLDEMVDIPPWFDVKKYKE